MRTPEDLLKEAYNNTDPCHDFMTVYAIKAIKQAQKEAYNEAIEDAAKNAKLIFEWDEDELSYVWKFDKESILKLKK